MASFNKRARGTGYDDHHEQRRRREEKRRREDEDVAVADARLEKEARRRRREKARVRKAAEDARARAAVALYVATRERGDGKTGGVAEETEVAGSSTGPGTKEGAQERAAEKEVEPKGPLREVPCLGCVQHNLECRARLVKGARTCWECKQRHVRCGTGVGGGAVRAVPPASAEPSVATALRELAAQVFDLSVSSLSGSEALVRLEAKIDALTRQVAWVTEELAAGGRASKMDWAGPLEAASSASEGDNEGRMEVDGAQAPSTSDTGADTTDAEEERVVVRKGKGRMREESSDEEESEEDSG
ncbi:hypothetical protein PLEOSDRAFT_1099763 [Pleurotus ostreatus PC15]|uniref:Uncharacterized protein n=1 Tax=Pleurotus ostreatus (strain PC15) TaxID=1137138 RepID=A0A067P0F5_PLEO1|nr:hypothetical protein PLEOSDRAFT_1099763 [Pleurotus ostreatus PC15]